MKVDVTCAKCGQRGRVEIGQPAAGVVLEEYLQLLDERLRHRPSFECFSGHLELAPPVPRFWTVHWETLGE